MSSASKGKKHRLIKSFGFAFTGIRTAILSERNMKIHLCITIIVIFASIGLSISMIEWLFVILAIGGMLSLEMLNSAIERVVDLVTEEYHPLAKQGKDIAAGAVLIYAMMSVMIGLIIFLPKLFHLFF
ncbi:undecaprenol kinase [Cytobacillus eiseniae]|uniref:Undecaprenol kinase n=1 Tax=Cytobacillus eiseniae TaxID=762947 RepID=A0ABS4RFH8_9BACI|nr:diacylglycerol kinase family protein [Cytobacillus eiseniae]MBP2241666.1 undecaprenol kinase [Cytobacillus eiseniae]